MTGKNPTSLRSKTHQGATTSTGSDIPSTTTVVRQEESSASASSLSGRGAASAAGSKRKKGHGAADGSIDEHDEHDDHETTHRHLRPPKHYRAGRRESRRSRQVQISATMDAADTTSPTTTTGASEQLVTRSAARRQRRQPPPNNNSNNNNSAVQQQSDDSPMDSDNPSVTDDDMEGSPLHDGESYEDEHDHDHDVDEEDEEDYEDDESSPPPPAGAGMMDLVESDGASSGQIAGDGSRGKMKKKRSNGYLTGSGFLGTGSIAPKVHVQAPPTSDTPEWQATINRVVRSVVSIRFCQPCAFDTDPAHTSEATGFVVDAERGYILTNRHVVGAGPFWGYCIFDNHEEADAYPVYRDPVHDFGFLRFDPKKIRHMKLEALELRPDLAKVGVEIRVIGNDAAERLSILSGIISRLDRNAPEYDGYSDFNTNYYQANAAASGGSSGSPVINVDGYAIALQAGGRTDGASTDFFLPLDRPLRALRCIQEGKPVARGDIQCQFLLKTFDECKRLGLSDEWEAIVRKARPDESNMLVAEIILPGGPSKGCIEEGDILLQINGELVTQLIRFDEILDNAVGSKIKMLLQRGGEDVEVEVKVGDLHAITPDRFVSVAGGSFHNLSYQQARLYAVACRGVYVCQAAGSFRFDGSDNGWLVHSIDHKKTPDLNTFIEVVKKIPDKARVVVTYKHLRDLHTLHTTIIYVDRHSSARMKMAIRNDVTGLWDFEDLGLPLPPVPPVPREASFITVEHTPHPAVAELVRSFVHVNCTLPVKLDGFPKNRKWGMGLVVDAEKGLVIISRAIVPYDLCDIHITIADSIIVEGKVVFLHPLQNYAIVKYDPNLVRAPVMSARLSTENITQGATTYFIGYNRIGGIVHAKTTVTEITTVAIPANAGGPRYRAINVDAITIDTSLGSQCGSGVLVAEDGTVQALWLTYLGERSSSSQRDEEYHLGLSTPTLLPVVSRIRQGITPRLRMLAVELRAVQMVQARVMGVSDEWIRKVTEANKAHHQLFLVTKRFFERGEGMQTHSHSDDHYGAVDDDKEPTDKAAGADGQPIQTLIEGDVLLTLNGRIITRVSELDVMYDHEEIDAVVVRESRELKLRLRTQVAYDLETNRAVSFCGAILHAPHQAVRQQISRLYSEVYISSRTKGSPAYQYGLAPTNFITHVGNQPTPDLDSFVKAVIKIPDNTYFRLKAVTFDNVPWVITMKKNEHYFPMMEWIKDPTVESGWRQVTYENGKPIPGEGQEGIMPAANFETDWVHGDGPEVPVRRKGSRASLPP